MRTLLKHCHLVSPGIELEHAALEIRDDRIAGVYEESPIREDGFDRVIDAEGDLVVPGFFDIHCHGHSGFDFCNATSEAFFRIGKGKLRDGVTSFLATTLSLPPERLQSVFHTAADYARICETENLPSLPGIHLEGPFFNPECAGAQNPAFLRLPDLSLTDRLRELFPIAKVSFSPELEGGLEYTRALVTRGIMPSGAHSAADYECFQHHRIAGMKHLTHFCNVMTPLHHLRFGMVGGGLLFEDVFLEMICDGVHLCDEMIRLIAKVKTSSRMMLITDSMCAAGMPDGDYELGGLPVKVVNGRATLLSSGAVAGSTLRYHEGLKRLHRVTGLPLRDLIASTSWNQARSLGIKDLGKLEYGYKADIVILDRDWNPKSAFLRGNYCSC